MNSHFISDYLARSGDTEIPAGNVEENETGFCVWRIEDDAIILVAVYGDGEHWNNWATKKAMKENLKNVIFATKRNPHGFVRKYKYKIAGYILVREV